MTAAHALVQTHLGRPRTGIGNLHDARRCAPRCSPSSATTPPGTCSSTAEILKPLGTTPETGTAPVLDPAGVRQFIVGSGGVGHYAFGTALTMASDGSVATVARDDDTFGVLKMTLRDGASDWEMVPTTGTAFRNADTQTTGAFSGSATSRP